jgi:hypothetical protein
MGMSSDAAPADGKEPDPIHAQYDFFISYNQHDEPHAEWIRHWLEVARYRVIYQKRDFRPGENFVLKMHEASIAARKTIMVLSKDYIDASFPQSEWAAAFAKDPKGTQRKLIPIRVKDCTLDGLLKSLIYIDLVNTSNEIEAVAKLFDGVDEREHRPSSRPPKYPWVAPGA